MLTTLVFPLFPWMLQLVLFAWFVVVLAFLSTSGTGEYREIFPNGTLTKTVCAATDALNDFMDTNNSLSCNFQVGILTCGYSVVNPRLLAVFVKLYFLAPQHLIQFIHVEKY